jgi:CBS domain-containing protein
MYRARDVMTTEIATISPKSTVKEAIRILVAKNISGAPVVAEDGALVGIISEYQLLEVIYDPGTKGVLVEDVMTKSVFTVDESAFLPEVASLFIVHRIRRVPVLRDGRLVGVIARRDLLNYSVEAEEEIESLFGRVRAVAGKH